jgi:tripartite-type tricarboxylate transporter receptor subunit TctC
MLIGRRRFIGTALASAAVLRIGTAQAQSNWPTKHVTLVLPSQPGGGSDVITRLLSVKLQQKWHQPVIVSYKPGANTTIATQFVLTSPPDGHTLGIGLSSLTINPALRNDLPYDTLKDLIGVSLVMTGDFGVFAHPSLPTNTIPELIDYARSNPGKLTYATGGVGSGSHLAFELFLRSAGVSMVHIPYSGGGAAALTDVLSGSVPLLVDIAFGVMPRVEQKQLKPIAITGPKRSPFFPGIPAICETIPGYEALSYLGVFASSRVPQGILTRISKDIQDSVDDPATQAEMRTEGMEPAGSTSSAYQSLIRSQIDKWTSVVRTAGIKVQ